MTEQPRRDRQGRLGYGGSEGERQENLALVKQLFDHCGKSHGIRSKHCDLLHWIVNFSGGGPLVRTLKELGQRRVKGFGLSCSEDTAQRVVDRLESLGILIVERSSNGYHGRNANAYSVDWQAAATVIREGRQSSQQTAECKPAKPRIANPQNKVSKPAKCGMQTRNLRNAHPQNADLHPIYQHQITSSSTTTQREEASTAVCESEKELSEDLSPVASASNRETWIADAHGWGVRLAELAIDLAIKAGRDVPRILRIFGSARLRWKSESRGQILYDLLTKSPRLSTSDEGLLAPYPFDFAAPNSAGNPPQVSPPTQEVRGPELNEDELQAEVEKLKLATSDERRRAFVAEFPFATDWEFSLVASSAVSLAKRILFARKRKQEAAA